MAVMGTLVTNDEKMTLYYLFLSRIRCEEDKVAWYNETFTFPDKNLPFLKQTYDGPCGVLAVVQVGECLHSEFPKTPNNRFKYVFMTVCLIGVLPMHLSIKNMSTVSRPRTMANSVRRANFALYENVRRRVTKPPF